LAALPGESWSSAAKKISPAGDAEFSLFLRKAFTKAAGYSEDA
jgi:hypothetical protein